MMKITNISQPVIYFLRVIYIIPQRKFSNPHKSGPPCWLPYEAGLQQYRMIGKKLRVKSQIIEIGYISPWKLQEQTGRNDLQIFLNKNQLVDETGSPLQGWSKTRIANKRMAHLEQAKPKKSAIGLSKTQMEIQASMRRSFHRKFYSKSTSLQKDNYKMFDDSKKTDADIFAKKYRPSQRPKLVTVGNFCTTEPCEPSEPQSRFRTLVLKKSSIQWGGCDLGRRKQKCQLKKQSLTQHLLKKQLINHKDFINSLENCLDQIDKIPKLQEKSNQLLSKTLKNFLTNNKKV